MSWLVTIYMLCAILTLFLYRRWYNESVPIYEIAIGWWHHLPVILTLHYRHKKAENDLIKKRAEIWSQLFKEALSRASSENWSDADWSRWSNNAEYTLTFIRL